MFDDLVQISPLHASEPAGDDAPWPDKLARLRDWLAPRGPVVVAYSGGVDSSVLLRVAHDVLGAGALGVIGRSDSYAQRELELALEQAAAFGATVEVVTTGELADPNFRSNPANRCYHCKTELYRKLRGVAERAGARAVVDGTIRDDVADWRPGRRAAAERGVESPLADLGFTKADVRAVAAQYGLKSAGKPASPCLASRIPYGSEITRDKLRAVENAEAALRALGFVELRVRHLGDTARVELALAELPRFAEPAVREAAVVAIQAEGFRFVTLDLEGFRSGKLNAALGLGAVAGPPVTKPE